MKMFTTRAQSLYIHAVYLTHHSDYPDLHYVHFGSSHFILSNHFQTKIFELFYCSFEAKCLEEGEYYALKFIPPLCLSIYLSLSLSIQKISYYSYNISFALKMSFLLKEPYVIFRALCCLSGELPRKHLQVTQLLCSQ